MRSFKIYKRVDTNMSEINGHTPPENDPHGEAELPLRDRLNSETGILTWEELTPHFARGVVLRVSTNVDLINVAEKVIRDDKASIEAWMSSGDLRRATDDDARDWVSREPQFWCVVSAPWVLAQEKPAVED